VLCPLAYDLGKSPPVIKSKLKNKRCINAQLMNRVVSADVGFGSSQTIADKEHFYSRPNADETSSLSQFKLVLI